MQIKVNNGKLVLPLLAFLVFMVSACDQEKKPDSSNATIPEFVVPAPQLGVQERYEIIQSTLAARWTFRLDRFSGRVCQLVETGDDNLAWEEMRIKDLPAIDSGDNQVRFKLFTSTIAARHTYLMDCLSGKAWTLIGLTDESGKVVENYWKPFAHQ